MSLECPSGFLALGLYSTAHLQVGIVFPFLQASSARSRVDWSDGTSRDGTRHAT